MPYTQAHQPLIVHSSLPDDTLLLVGAAIQEGVSRLYQMSLDVMVEHDKTFSFDDLLGKPVAVELRIDPSTSRFFHGICCRLSQGDHDEGFTHYSLEVVPKLWLLTKTAHSRIFRHLTAKDVLTQILNNAGISDFDLGGFTGGSEVREYWTQYRESDFNFISRVLEELGAYYYFEHEKSKHTFLVADTPGGHQTLPNEPTVTYTDLENLPGAVISSLRKAQEIRSTQYTVYDFNFEAPDNKPTANAQIQPTAAAGAVTHNLNNAATSSVTKEVYDYPDGYFWPTDAIDPNSGGPIASATLPDGTPVAKVRMAAEAAQAVQLFGTGNVVDFTSGYQFTVKSNFVYSSSAPAFDGPYVLTSVSHTSRLNGPFTPDQTYEYSNDFECIPVALPFRPPRVTPRPVIHGTQTALVLGIDKTTSSSDDIFTDGFGRVKLLFPWDREDTPGFSPSRWARVGTPWAGQGWGAIHIPRVGMEVIVAFEEGDPERPIVVGCVYNGDKTPPYTLPDKKTQSGIKSRSTTQGTPDNFNELRFEDKKGSEEIYFHAEKDFNRVVENNDTLKVGADKKDKGDQTIEIFNNQSLTVGSGKAQAADGSQTVDIYKDRTTTLETGNDTLTIKMGNQTIQIKTGSQSTEAMQSIELKVGQNSIKIDQMGITISGLKISLSAQLTAEIASQLSTKLSSQLQTQVQGTMTQLSGSAMHQISGGIIMMG
jgi:type VI secretion system secreted protein VgrG